MTHLIFSSEKRLGVMIESCWRVVFFFNLAKKSTLVVDFVNSEMLLPFHNLLSFSCKGLLPAAEINLRKAILLNCIIEKS